MTTPAATPTKPDFRGFLLRIGMFVLIGGISLVAFATVLNYFLAPEVNSMFSTFAAAAMARPHARTMPPRADPLFRAIVVTLNRR